MEQAHGQRPLRADAERTVHAILEAAERVLSADPSATMEQIARAAGVARTTVHRRFTSRDALVDALAEWAARQFHDAVRSAHPDTAPPLVALYQVTANVLRVKIGWGFAMGRSGSGNPEVDRVHADVLEQCDALFRRARDAGALRADTDVEWARRVYYALIHEATQDQSRHGDGPGTVATQAADGGSGDAPDRIDALASRVVGTLLHGVGQEGAAFTPGSGTVLSPRP